MHDHARKDKIDLIRVEKLLRSFMHYRSLCFLVVVRLERGIKLCMYHDHQPRRFPPIHRFQFLLEPLVLIQTLCGITVQT